MQVNLDPEFLTKRSICAVLPCNQGFWNGFRLRVSIRLAGSATIRMILFITWVMLCNPPAVQGFTPALRFFQGGKHRFT
jgi:hypothetical protein